MVSVQLHVPKHGLMQYRHDLSLSFALSTFVIIRNNMVAKGGERTLPLAFYFVSVHRWNAAIFACFAERC